MGTSAEILRAAKARLTPDRWFRGGGPQDSPVWKPGFSECAATAIEHAAAEMGNLQAAFGVFRRANGIGCIAITTWNDARTLEEVHEGFDKAIELAERRG